MAKRHIFPTFKPSTTAHPQHTMEVLQKHVAKVTLKRGEQNTLLGAHQTMAANLQAELAANPSPARMLETVEINNMIAQLQHDLAEDIPITLDKVEKVEYDAKIKSHNKKLEDLKINGGKVYMIIMG